MTALPPWTLTGSGLVLIAHFPEMFVRQHGFLDDFQQAGYRGWIGTVMLVDYTSSDVGPYCELLFIPGLFNLNGRTTFSISKIYVSTQVSVDNGIANWGIPKEQADFTITTQPDGSKTYLVRKDGQAFFSVRVSTGGLSFPVSTRLLPGFQVTQRRGHELVLTAPSASGKGQFASLHALQINTDYFPDISQGTRLAAIAMTSFEMVFPVADVL
ncbi:acetoacetate decarboxylase family protein [Fibrella forsythiae]|uniref:Acetoacetate decarboxylase family protein n=1 Tax=Fibrella forsythiae TaxID=2817061 RepID=A0ABS3JDQ9_9BACT|nr:acetoacetate decarboxylase family protein [Fibrella forsythiae]MBO0948130.1 acetoacetate decarboxylase family protein [Fibrella forsythiae]